MTVVVRVENVSKKYQLGQIGTQSLKGDFHRWWAMKRGKEDPFSKVEAEGQWGDFWALRDISFDIRQGEAIGIIGKNGAGKSTLLKILSRITLPTTGSVKVRGRIASLLEVGTGFNPDLSGRENIYLNGAILGMTKQEVKRKFDEIVDFSGVEKFIDTPVKRYSSGMYVRLAFAVAAHLDSEILILDEVLAVGDAEFQRKCLSKMNDVTRREGRTVIFVSHSMSSVKSLCNTCVLLKSGTVSYYGEIFKGIELYQDENVVYQGDLPIAERSRNLGVKLSLEAKIIDFKVITDSLNPTEMDSTKPFKVEITVLAYQDSVACSGQFLISDGMQCLTLFDSATFENKLYTLKKGVTKISCEVAPMNLYNGKYQIDCVLSVPNQGLIDYVPRAYSFSVSGFDPNNTGNKLSKHEEIGFYYVKQSWQESIFINFPASILI